MTHTAFKNDSYVSKQRPTTIKTLGTLFELCFSGALLTLLRCEPAADRRSASVQKLLAYT